MKSEQEIREKMEELKQIEKRADSRYDYILLKLTAITGSIPSIIREVTESEYATEEFKKAYIKGLKRVEKLVIDQIDRAREDYYKAISTHYELGFEDILREEKPETEEYYDEEDY